MSRAGGNTLRRKRTKPREVVVDLDGKTHEVTGVTESLVVAYFLIVIGLVTIPIAFVANYIDNGVLWEVSREVLGLMGVGIFWALVGIALLIYKRRGG